jgi:hypothetical protein
MYKIYRIYSINKLTIATLIFVIFSREKQDGWFKIVLYSALGGAYFSIIENIDRKENFWA